MTTRVQPGPEIDVAGFGEKTDEERAPCVTRDAKVPPLSQNRDAEDTRDEKTEAKPAPLARMSRRVSVRFRVGSGARIGATRRYHRSFSAAVDITPSRLMFLRRRRARR